ncbi:hypothetical protein D3C85_799170 [compost metagenome]
MNSATAGPWSFTAAAMPPAPASSEYSAEPPMIANHTIVTPLGMTITPVTNSRMVRPREMRAMKVPTKGAQEIHQAQ